MPTKEQMEIVWEEVNGVEVERKVSFELHDAEPDNNIPYAYVEVLYVVDAYGRNIELNDDRLSFFQNEIEMRMPTESSEDSY